MRLAALSLLALAALAACAAPPPAGPRGVYDGAAARAVSAPPRGTSNLGAPVVEATASGAELAFVSRTLAELQFRSFASGREHCGYLGLDAQDRWITTPIVAGREASCPLPRVPPGMRVVASFHTHARFDPRYHSELPSVQDVLGDQASDIDGYISTPGGRLWLVDTDTMTVRQLCGRGCLPQDPTYDPSDDGPIPPAMTLDELVRWERSPPLRAF